MNLCEHHYRITLTKDATSRFFYCNSFQIPKLRKISVSIGIKEFLLKKNLTTLLLLEFIAANCPVLTKAKKSVLLLKVKKNSPNGAKLNLHRQKAYDFMQKLSFYIFPSFKLDKNNFSVKRGDSFSFLIKEIDSFYELTFFYRFFKMIKDVSVNVRLLRFLDGRLELLFFLTSFKLPVHLARK